MTTLPQEYYDKLEARFLQLLSLMQPLFPADKLTELKKYVEVGEYGLALDAAQWVFTTEKKQAPPAALRMLKELAETMEHPLQEPFANMT